MSIAIKLLQIASLILLMGLNMSCGSNTTQAHPETKTNQDGNTKKTSKSDTAAKSELLNFGPPPKDILVKGKFLVRIHDDILKAIMNGSILSTEDAIQIWRGMKNAKGQKELTFIPKDMRKEEIQRELKKRSIALAKVGQFIIDTLKKQPNFVKSEPQIMTTMSLLGTLVLKTDKSMEPLDLQTFLLEAIIKAMPNIKNVKGEEIIIIERNYRLELEGHNQKPPNDRYWLRDELWGLDKISMQKAWEKAEVNWEHRVEGSIIAAVLDTGIKLDHPDLVENLWENPFEKSHGMDGKDNENENGYVDDIHGVNIRARFDKELCEDREQKEGNPFDELGHGTGVAEVIAAVGNNDDPSPNAEPTERSTVGVTGNSHVKLMALKIFCEGTQNPYEGTVAHAIEAIEYAIKMRADVINASWSLPRSIGKERLQILEEAFVKAGNAGVLLVTSAGNLGVNNDLDVNKRYPRGFNLDNVLVVAATGINDHLQGNSNFGPASVHLAAPGDGIMITLFDSDGNLTIQTRSGTSLAAPFVAGCAALVQARRKGKNMALLPPLKLREILMKSGDDIPSLLMKVREGKRLNCEQAIEQST